MSAMRSTFAPSGDGHRLVRDGEVGRAGGDDGDEAERRAGRRAQNDRAPDLVVADAVGEVVHGCEVLGVGARRDQRAAGVGEHRDRDRSHLPRRFARTVDDLRQAGAELAMRIDASEVKVAHRKP